ncbi:PREDICTED: nudix hydrolase 3-like isoform X2 [Tarenaya hassleriana]|uniref:nudix hydrolase 3-like isoform X2 n=1 Tax=Tarenaya hassleriana TaxID=28532 RepID=UPI00053C1360|nr:PREDICTED: nudix hydrolase 3-like isoform X2 [Tarenaya hassleriana]
MGGDQIDVLNKTGEKNGVSKPRGVHVWIFVESTQELLLRRRPEKKDLRPAQWDISSCHIPAGGSSLMSAQQGLQEELGIELPKDAFEKISASLQQGCSSITHSVTNDGKYVNNEFNDVYLVTILDPIPLEAFALQDEEVSAIKYISYEEYRSLLAKEDPSYVPHDVNGDYGQIFGIIKRRYQVNTEERSLSLQKQLQRYAPVTLEAQLTELSEADQKALRLIVKAAKIVDDIFYEQVWCNNPALRDWLKESANASELDKLKWAYFLINKCPWSSLDENEAFLTTADSAVKLCPDATKSIAGWKGLEYRAAFPLIKPPGANFYPPDMDKAEFTSWLNSLEEEQKHDVTGFFSVIRRQGEANRLSDSNSGLYSTPYSEIYRPFLVKASELLHKAGDLSSSPSLKKLLHSKADAFLSNDYYESDIAWMDLDSKLDITIGPYETYQDELFGYKATFEAFIGIRDDKATSDLKLFGDNLKLLEENLPLDNMYKSKEVTAAPIRVIQLIYNAGDVRGPQIVAYNLPNDERIVKARGTSMVMLKNVQEAKFKHILKPIAEICISEEQRKFVDFDSYFTHTICHECCHGIGPHTITLPDGRTSTVRQELQELHSAMEEAKADIAGLWALKFLITKGLLSEAMKETMYVSFLAGCFRSVRFGLTEAHGKGQALQFNWLYEKGAFVFHDDNTFSVDFAKVEDGVESLSHEILTIQARGDKNAASSLLDKYCTITKPLKTALDKLESIKVPTDIAPTFPIADSMME